MQLRKLALCLIIGLPFQLHATINAGMQWDVQTTGNNVNGGGFDSTVASPGTNESLGAGTAVSCTVQATTTQVICTPAISATTHGPGNVIGNLTGAGCTTGSFWFEILSQSAGTATLDRSAGTAASVCTATLGGSLVSPFIFTSTTGGAQSGNTIWVQSGTYTLAASPTIPGFSVQWIGYQTTHGDLGTPPLITTSTNSVNIFALGSNNSYVISNINMSNTATTRGVGITTSNSDVYVFSSTMTGFSSATTVGGVYMDRVYITGCTSVCISNPTLNGLVLIDSIITGSGGNAIQCGNGSPCLITRSIIANTTGIGLTTASTRTAPIFIIDSVFYNSSSDGVKITGWGSGSSMSGFMVAHGNIFYGNGGIGMNLASAGSWNSFQAPLNSYNAYGANTGGNRSATWPVGVNDVTLTATPFTNAGSGDFSLNSTAGGGAALKALGYPGLFPGGLTTGFLDIGPVQHQASAGGASNYAVSR